MTTHYLVTDTSAIGWEQTIRILSREGKTLWFAGKSRKSSTQAI